MQNQANQSDHVNQQTTQPLKADALTLTIDAYVLGFEDTSALISTKNKTAIEEAWIAQAEAKNPLNLA